MWSSDFEIAPGESFGEWLHAEIADEAFLEQHGFMPDRVRAAAARLQRGRPDDERFVVEVPWLGGFTAFTAPGRYVYFSRRLLERCPHEDSAAFVIAHEIAHHDLGHLDYFKGPFARRAARSSPGLVAVMFFRAMQKRIYSPERELDADRHAIDLCIAAGYDPGKCLYLFHILELIALDYGDLGAVYGLDTDSDEELSPEASTITKARIWLYQRRRGYLPIQDRQAELQRYISRTHGIEVRPRGV
ncbi:MAG TPA: M48 family metalloprotease [Gemmatimonadaceae bacterium]|nr:M48 family metalloprotease [Gemmatimonadaceae bacterium]